MKRGKTFIFTALFFFAFLHQTNALQARFAYSTFYTKTNGPFVETYLSVSGQSVRFVPSDPGKYQASIEVTMIFRQGEKFIFSDKYNLLSPETTDSVKNTFNFLDQKRIPLANGKYQLELSISDKNSPGNPYVLHQGVSIEYYPNILSISDLEALASYEKTEETGQLVRNGYNLVPYVDNFYPDEYTALKFYAEIYNARTVLGEESFLISWHIERFENKQVLDAFHAFSRQQAREVNVILAEFELKDLPSGNYNLVMDVRNKKNDLLSSKLLFFQRSRQADLSEAGSSNFMGRDISKTFVAQYTNKDTLMDMVSCLWPVGKTHEQSFIDNAPKVADENMLQQFFYDFWVTRDQGNPLGAWLKYKSQVDFVNGSYSTPTRKGYETDRGRVYLQYGPPNQISPSYNEPSSYPYEIWQYYALGNQSNRKFVFYSTELASKNFILLHSDATGEPFDNEWQTKLMKRNFTSSDLDDNKTPDHFGKKVDGLYQNPR